MNHFLGTFLSGAGRIVQEMLAQRLKDLRLIALPDGAAEFETSVPYSDLNLFCFNNVFRVLHKSRAKASERVLDGYLRELLSAEADWKAVQENPAKVRTFRLVTSQENRLVSVDRKLREQLEKKIARLSGLRVDRSRPDTEFWLLFRREGVCYFLKRLSRHTAYDKLLDPGELHPELAHMMCWLTRPQHTDTVLDPFCGCGAVPLQRCKRFPYTKIYAFDKNEKALARTREKLPRKDPRITVENRDALTLSRFLPGESVDAVITDPPWGLYENVGMALSEFYRRMLQEFYAVLKPGGKLALLTAGKDDFFQAAEAVPLIFTERHDLLVSGKKCALFLLLK